MFTVYHYNFGNVRHFDTLAEAKAFCIRAAFDATVYSTATSGRIARYSAISGWSDV